MRDARPKNLLLIHGAGGGGWEWRLWLPLLQAHGHACHAPDLQPVREGLEQTTLEDYLGQMREALARLPAPRVLVGASLGGLLATILAVEAGVEVEALVLVNPLPPAPWHRQLPVRDWPARVPWGHQARLASTRRAMPDADPATALFAFRHWRDESGLVLRQAHAGVALRRPVLPVLSIIGGRDEDVPASASQAWAQDWQADIERLPEAGHLSPLFGPEACNCAEHVAMWLSAR